MTGGFDNHVQAASSLLQDSTPSLVIKSNVVPLVGRRRALAPIESQIEVTLQIFRYEAAGNF